MLFASPQRYHPRSAQEKDRGRRDAALRAQIADVTVKLSALEKEQQVQFKRIADIQCQLDDMARLLKKLAPS